MLAAQTANAKAQTLASAIGAQEHHHCISYEDPDPSEPLSVIASVNTPQTLELTTEPGYTATTAERAVDSQVWASVLQRAQPIAKALRALPDLTRFEGEAATAHWNKHPIELQQLANLRYLQCLHLDTALQEIQAGYKQTCWAWWAFPTDQVGRSEPAMNGLQTQLTPATALSLIGQHAYNWRVLLEEIADTGWKTLLPSIDHSRVQCFVKFWKRVYETAPDQAVIPTWFLAVLHKLQTQPAAPPQSLSQVSACIGQLKMAAGKDHPRHLVKAWWHLLQASQLPPLYILELWTEMGQYELESAVRDFDSLLATPCENVEGGFALLERRQRIAALTQDIQKLADTLEYQCKHRIITVQQPALFTALARKIRLVQSGISS